MNRKHALPISLLLGVAIAAGAFAATRGGADTAAQATVAPVTADTALAAENARLDRYEATLDRLLAQARRGRGGSGAAASGAVVVATAPAQTQTWDDDDDGEDHHGDDDNSGHGSDDGGGGHEDDD